MVLVLKNFITVKSGVVSREEKELNNERKEPDIELNNFWLGLLILGTIVLGWILSAYKIIWFGWLMISGGIVLGTVAGLVEGWLARSTARKKQRGLTPNTVIGSNAGIVAGVIAGFVVWMFVLAGVEIFIQHDLDTTWSVSWWQGLVFESQLSSGIIPWSVIPFIALATALTKPFTFIAALFFLKTACSQATVVGVGSFYFSILTTMAATAVALSSTIIVNATVAQTKILATSWSEPERRSLFTVAALAGLGLVVGWIVDRFLLPGLGEQLARSTQECGAL